MLHMKADEMKSYFVYKHFQHCVWIQPIYAGECIEMYRNNC
jgi:hypothetical protein